MSRSRPLSALGCGPCDDARSKLPLMAERTPVFDPRAVIDGRAPGRRPVAFIAGNRDHRGLRHRGPRPRCGAELPGGGRRGAVHGRAAAGAAAGSAAGRGRALGGPPGAEPRANLVFAFGWGAGIAALLALLINTAGLIYVTQPDLGTTRGEFVSAVFGAPLVEETLKGAVLVGLLWRRRQEFDGPTDGVIYAAMVGLGFAMIENVGYYINALVTPVQGGVALLGFTFVLRGDPRPHAAPALHLDDRARRGLCRRPPAGLGACVAGARRLAGGHGAARRCGTACPPGPRGGCSSATGSCSAWRSA